MFERPILVTGCPRSGTSLVAGVLKACGMFTGKVDKMNENIRIRDKIIKPFMITQNWDAEGVNVPPLVENVELIGRPRIRGVLNVEGWGGGQWMYKDRRIALMFPIWAKMFPQAVFVIVRRSDQQIITSCLQTAYMNGEPERWVKMIADYKVLFAMMKQRLNVVEVRPDRMIGGNYEEMKELIIKHTGLTWQEDKVKQYIEPRLWRKEAIQ